MKTFDPFDRIRIISLPHRTDRRHGMNRELQKMNLAGDPRVAYYPAIRPESPGAFTSIGARGVYASHLNILREAAGAGEAVLILEDDCAFAEAAADCTIETDWDIFYGGYTAHSPDDLHNSDVEGAHMMGFTAGGARRVVDYLDSLDIEGVHPPIDAAYVWFRRAHPEVSTYFAVPSLAGQRPSRSDIATLQWYDRWPLVRQFSNMVRSLKYYQ